jgi:hypothetical protein
MGRCRPLRSRSEPMDRSWQMARHDSCDVDGSLNQRGLGTWA